MKAKRVLCMLAAILLVVAMMLMFLTGCNRQVIDTTFSYDNAILALPDGSVIIGVIVFTLLKNIKREEAGKLKAGKTMMTAIRFR